MLCNVCRRDFNGAFAMRAKKTQLQSTGTAPKTCKPTTTKQLSCRLGISPQAVLLRRRWPETWRMTSSPSSRGARCTRAWQR